ncbi:ATPase [Sphingomicrobium astaxanthinifaciens]|uniref:F0F1 ATP synthase subunit B family protein n=1 Tax=Sphingomicrobium astaxanthinifaciens TaxID=1227949 RepID=UPI001FCB969A|nr:ATPase [Sphingomicrobium astaxanthinifaciens]MCJ7421944.1 ATPase [Sphingomicrobium astaxanthinifaciens]
MPQLAQIAEIYASQLFWLTVFFGAILVFIGYGMVPKIQKTVDLRDDKIAADLKEAEAAQKAADALEEDYRAGLDAARADAAKANAEAKATAAKKTEASLKRAETTIDKKLAAAAAELAQQREAARAELEAMAAEATQAMVQKVAGLSIDQRTATAAVKKELTHG